MKARTTVLLCIAFTLAALAEPQDGAGQAGVKRLLYVTSPDGAGGTRNPPGLYVYDIDDGHKLVKHIPIPDMGGTRG